MRIISGSLKGRPIKRPEGIRATQDKVRKALFDILRDTKGLSFLDLYAGSGSMGLEALSHGASKVVFVEHDRRCIKSIRENLSVIGVVTGGMNNASGHCQVIGLDVFLALEKLDKINERFDIVFLDPPYYKDSPAQQLPLKKMKNSNWCGGLAKKTLLCLTLRDILCPTSLVICQHFKSDTLPESVGYLRLIKQAKYGDTLLSFYQK